jgi:hypothetical protein
LSILFPNHEKEGPVFGVPPSLFTTSSNASPRKTPGHRALR